MLSQFPRKQKKWKKSEKKRLERQERKIILSAPSFWGINNTAHSYG
jgi:hypothetical protein